MDRGVYSDTCPDTADAEGVLWSVDKPGGTDAPQLLWEETATGTARSNSKNGLHS